MTQIDIKRVERDLYDLFEFGYNPEDKGVYRQGLTEVDMQARHWVIQLFEKEGLACHLDPVGNVCGRYGDSDKPAITIGSHLDSVPAGGMFDGTLGVMAGLECIRTIKQNNIKLEHPIEIIGTSEEEGRFGGMLGAQALTGNLTREWLEKAHDPSGEYLTDALEKCGFDWREVFHARRDPESIKAFLELHIEQGPVLDSEQLPIGIVNGISGVFKWLVRLTGKADHAGTAPMNLRSDAFMGIADFAHEVSRIIDEDGSDSTRLTIGHVELKPGFAHTVPGEAFFTLVGRDMDHDTMHAVSDACRKVLSAIARKHKLHFEYEQLSWLEPRHFSNDLVDVIEQQTLQLGYPYKIMPSGAGHDCQFFADIVPTGLIFIPSVGGISHAPDEWTHWADVEKGVNLLLQSIIAIDKI